MLDLTIITLILTSLTWLLSYLLEQPSIQRITVHKLAAVAFGGAIALAIVQILSPDIFQQPISQLWPQ